jgi:hypothetical protein
MESWLQVMLNVWEHAKGEKEKWVSGSIRAEVVSSKLNNNSFSLVDLMKFVRAFHCIGLVWQWHVGYQLISLLSHATLLGISTYQMQHLIWRCS